MENWIWALILVLMLSAATYFTARINKRALFVSALHNGIWAGAIGLLGTNLIAYDTAGASAWFTLILGLLGFNAGVWASRFVGPAKSAMLAANQQTVRLSIVSRGPLAFISVIYATAFIYYLVTIQQRFGIAAILLDPVAIRASRDPSYLEAVPLPIRILLYLGPALFAIYAFKPAVDMPLPLYMRISAASILALSMLAMLQRTNLFMGLLLWAALLLTQPRSPNSKRVPGRESRDEEPLVAQRPWSNAPKLRLIASILIVGIVAFGAFQLVGGALRKDGSQASSTGAVAPVLETLGLVSPYVYYTGGIAGFLQLASSSNTDYPVQSSTASIVVGDFNPQTWGARTFAPIIKFIPDVNRLPSNSAFIETPILTNVFTWLEDFYRDFRGVGVLIGTLATGFVVSALHIRREHSASAFWLQAVLISPIFLATFVPKYSDTLLLAELVFIAAISCLHRGHNARASALPKSTHGIGVDE